MKVFPEHLHKVFSFEDLLKKLYSSFMNVWASPSNEFLFYWFHKSCNPFDDISIFMPLPGYYPRPIKSDFLEVKLGLGVLKNLLR